jgi:hypothetical protein
LPARVGEKVDSQKSTSSVEIILRTPFEYPKIVENIFCDGRSFLNVTSWLKVWLLKIISGKRELFKKPDIFKIYPDFVPLTLMLES